MNQLTLFPQTSGMSRLPTVIQRDGDGLLIPEGVRTIPATHGLHRFPGKFIPNLPRYLIRETLPGDARRTICDPFCGSGTTLVEAALEGRPFIGTDIDRLSVLIASAKTVPLSHKQLQMIRRAWSDHDYEHGNPELEPDVPTLRHWFTETAIRQLTSIKARCLSFPEPARRFCLVVFSSVIRRVSNADDQTQKTYVSGTLKKTPPVPQQLFPVFLERAVDGMSEYASLLRRPPCGRVLHGDARSFRDYGEIGDVLTSPPYIDSIDYMYNQMLEYFWLMPELGLTGYDDFRRLRRVPMGFHRDATGVDALAHALGDQQADFEALVATINDRSPKEAASVVTFFSDYIKHLRNTYDTQRRGSYYVSIVGNSLIRDVVVPTAEILVALHSSAGYRLTDRFSYEIRRHYMKFPRRSNSGTIKMDHVLVFERI
jgi:hypothetical protein